MSDTNTLPEGAIAFPMSRKINDDNGDGNCRLALLRSASWKQPSRRSHQSSRRSCQSSRRSRQSSSRRIRGRSASPHGSSKGKDLIDADFSTVASECPNRRRRSSPSSSLSSSSKFLPSNALLCPRADVWIYICASSFAGVVSVARANARYQELLWQSRSTSTTASENKMGSYAAAIVAILSINGALTLLVGIAYRLKSTLNALTRPFPALCNASPELPLASLSLLSWFLCTILTNMSNKANPAFGAMMEMYAQNGVWSANFFYALWTTGALSLYLVADLCAGNHPTGMITQIAAANHGGRSSTRYRIAGTRLWIMTFASSVLLASFSASKLLGPICAGPFLRNSPYCSSATTSLTMSVVGIVLCLACAVTRRVSSVRIRVLRPSTNSVVERALGVAVLLGYTCNAAVATAPGGSGTNVGNLFVASWFAFVLALMLNVNYLGQHFTTLSSTHCHQPSSRTSAYTPGNSFFMSQKEVMLKPHGSSFVQKVLMEA